MPDNLENTLDLVRQAQEDHDGANGALEELFRRYYPKVLKVVRLRMGQNLRRRLESGDIVQDALMEAFRNFQKFEVRNEASLINWLSRLAENKILHAAERQSADKRDPNKEVPLRPSSSSDETGPQEINLMSDTIVPLDRVIRDEEHEAVLGEIEQLPEKYRDFIILRNFLGMTFKEIAAEKGKNTEGAARMMHAKAMLELAQQLKRRRDGGGEAGRA